MVEAVEWLGEEGRAVVGLEEWVVERECFTEVRGNYF